MAITKERESARFSTPQIFEPPPTDPPPDRSKTISMCPEMVELAKSRAAANDTSKLDRMRDELRRLRECPACPVQCDDAEIQALLRKRA